MAAEDHLNLSSCTALTTLRVDCRCAREVAPDWAWLLFLLRHLEHNPSRPRTIIVMFQSPTQALTALHSFAPAIDYALVVAAPASVIFEFDYRRKPRGLDADEHALLGKFSHIRARGLLTGALYLQGHNPGESYDHASNLRLYCSHPQRSRHHAETFSECIQFTAQRTTDSEERHNLGLPRSESCSTSCKNNSPSFQVTAMRL